MCGFDTQPVCVYMCVFDTRHMCVCVFGTWQAILANLDIYRPLNLGDQLRDANLEVRCF
jgi:hypothetical protein